LFAIIQLALLLLCVALVSISASPAHPATIRVINHDNPAEGFKDPSAPDSDSTAGGNPGTTLGEQRLIAFQHAADIWAGLLSSPVEIKVGANFNPLPCNASSAVLGSAGPTTVHRDFVGAPLPITWYTQALANSLAAMDLVPGVDDMGATFNSSIGTTCSFPIVWYYGLDGNSPVDTIDFVTVVLHELAHGLGFLSLVNLQTGQKLGGFNDVYMRNLEDHSTGKFYPEMTNAQRVNASKKTGDLHWVGPNVIAVSGSLIDGVHLTGHVEIYAPNPREPGSSVSHFSTDLVPDKIMEPFYTGANHDIGLTLELLADLGWGLASGNQLEFIPPGAVANLATGAPGLTTIDLSWTAPGDDGSAGTAASYDIRYAQSNITNANWPSATLINGEPTPLAAGALQTLTVSGLSCGRKYYFALRSLDEIGNVSRLSNVASGKTATCPTITVGSLLPPGEVNIPYNATISIAGGNPPYTVVAIKGSLPAGLAFGSPDITGTPLKARDSNVTIRVTDQVGASTKKTLKLRVLKAVLITNNALAAGRSGRSYDAAVKATRGKKPYSWALVFGALPAGLDLDPATGRITGVPTETGNFAPTFRVTDSLGGMAQKSLALTITLP